MASVPALNLISFNLAFSMGFLMNFKPLLTFFVHNCNVISPIHLIMSVHTFFLLLLLLMTINFFITILLLILHFSIPNSAYTKQLTTAARVLTVATLLFMVSMFAADFIPDIIKISFAAAVMMIVYVSYVRSSLNLLFNRLTAGFAPVCFALCVSMATLLYLTEQSPSFVYHGGCHTDSLSNIVLIIHVALFGNFILAIVLLFLCAASNMQPRLITAVHVEPIAKAAVAMSIIVILIDVYMTASGSASWN